MDDEAAPPVEGGVIGMEDEEDDEATLLDLVTAESGTTRGSV